MSGPGFLEKLLDGAAVEWVPLGEAVKIQRGQRLVKSQLEETGDFAVFQNSMTPLGYYHDANVKQDSAFIVCAGAAGEIGYSKSGFWAADDVYFFQPPNGVVDKYLYHWLLTQKNTILAQVRRASIPRLSKSVVEKLSFPIPCPDDPKKSLAIQAEIVRILDAFTELTAELTAELGARKKQYKHYRDQLLSFDGKDVEWKTLGELVTTIKTGKLNANAAVPNGKYPFFTCDAKPFKIDKFEFDTEAIIVSGNGSQVGHINYYNGKFNAYQRTYILSDCVEAISMKFLLSYLKGYLRPYIMQYAKKGSVPYITMPMLDNFGVPVPSLDEQARIVEILDRFDTLTTSLSEGLPREIALRQKQYEYYRDLLLNFPKPAEVTP